VNELSEIPRRGRWRIALAVLVLLLAAAVAGGYWYFHLRGVVFTDDARLAGQLLDLAPQIGGQLAAVNFDTGQSVLQGQVVFVLGKDPFEAAVRRADAAAAAARAGLRMARAQYEKVLKGPRAQEISIAQANLEHAMEQERLATAEWNRIKNLARDQVVSGSARDKAETTWQASSQARIVAQKQLDLLLEGARSEDVASAKSNVDLQQAQLGAAEAALNQARLNLDYTEIHAPFSGVVVRRWQDPGAILSAGRPVVTLLDPATLHVNANIEEKSLYRVAVGDPVEVSIDAYPRIPLKGRLSKILRATNSQFSLIPSEGASGTFIKVAQRVPIEVELTSLPKDLPIGPGLSVELRILTRSHAAAQAAVTRHE